MRKNSKRGYAIQIFVLIVINIHWHDVLFPYSLILPFYYCAIVGYAYRKTRICPAEIMIRVPILRWSRTFTLMYKEWAIRMQLIYFSFGVLVVVKGAYLLLLLAHWIDGML